MTQSMTVPGVPVPKGRPRLCRSGRAFTPQKTRDAEARVAAVARRHIKHKYEKGAPLYMWVTFYMPIPASWSEKKREAHRGKYHTSRADLDNILKLIMDGMKDCWHDDSQVVEIHAIKIYSSNPRTEVIVQELDVNTKD